jgi:hypothetical protein
MGTWGTGIYDNDAASDLRATFAELARLPLDASLLLERLIDSVPATRTAGDEDHAASWIALADLFHIYGLEETKPLRMATVIIETGADADMQRELGMDEADRARRARTLERALVRWQTPHARPRKRRILEAPEELLIEGGQCVAYPTRRGDASDTTWTSARIRSDFQPDGWGCFVALASTLRHGYLASYLVVRLSLRTTERPTSDEILGSHISGTRSSMPGIPPDPAVKVVSVTKLEARKLGLEAVARHDLDEEALREAFGDRYALLEQPYWTLAGLLRPSVGGGWLERPTTFRRWPWKRFVRGSATTRR